MNGIYFSGKSTKFRCSHCNCDYSDRRRLYLHQMKEHYQRGNGQSSQQARPWGDSVLAPWQQPDGSVDEDLHETYEANEPIILQPHQRGQVMSTYNFPIDNAISVEDLTNYLHTIYDEVQYSLKFNLSLGIILRNLAYIGTTNHIRILIFLQNPYIFNDGLMSIIQKRISRIKYIRLFIA